VLNELIKCSLCIQYNYPLREIRIICAGIATEENVIYAQNTLWVVPKLEFVIKPDLTNALLPLFMKWMWRYAIGAVVTYALFSALLRLGAIAFSTGRLVFALIIVVLVFSFSSIKMQILILHNTRYLFYDAHVVEERKLLFTKRASMPYKQISKIINNSGIWDRVSGASNMVLRTARPDDGQDFVLRSIKNSEDVEHRIYKLLKQDAQTHR